MSEKELSKIRAAAGKAGAAARWSAARKPTKLVRIYVEDAERIAAMANGERVTSAEIVSRLLPQT